MITVRYPNGQAVQYNNGHYIFSYTGYTDLYADSGKKDFIARVLDGSGAIIECVTPCKVGMGITGPMSVGELESLLREQWRGKVAAIKKLLNTSFSAYAGWKK